MVLYPFLEPLGILPNLASRAGVNGTAVSLDRS